MKNKYICVCCGIEVFRYECQVKNSKRIYCSNKCIGIHKRNGSEIECKFCNKRVYRRFGEQDLDKGRINQFCSRQCAFRYRKKNVKETTYLKDGAIHTHILVAEKYLGRKLKKGEIVHHIDEDKHNNKYWNLAVLPNQSIHAKIHFGTYDFEKYKLINLI